MPLGTPAPLNKRKKPAKIITDLSHITQDEYESEPEASEFDLGTKIRTPKDIMLEELSLLKNRGSKMFKMRQQRVERFIYENNPDVFSSESMDNLQKFVPSIGCSLGGQTINIGGHFVSKQVGQVQYGGILIGGGAPVPPPKPGSKGAGAGGAGGAASAGTLSGGDHGKDGKGEGGSEWSPLGAGGKDSSTSKKQILIKTYVSPWEKAMKGDEGLIATLKSSMPGPIDRMDLPKYKCFNRTAMPFGGFEKANQFLKFQLPDAEATKQEPEPAVVYQHDISCRPSFNRTPIGWVGSSEPSSIHMENDAVPFDAETEESARHKLRVRPSAAGGGRAPEIVSVLMPSKPKPLLTPLPWAELLAYWLLSFGSHLYSFYQLHRFSKEHEAGLERTFQLEKGLLKGFKRDPSDFEWSLWTECAKRSLLWSLIGHGVVSRLSSMFCPKLKVHALTSYGLLAASSVLGIKGVSVLLVHLGVTFSVAQLRKPALSWACNLLLLSTLHIQPLQDIQKSWYTTEEEYYLLLFSVAVCGLRFISFSLEHCWCPADSGEAVRLCWLLSYTFYHPFFYNGPIITYKDYVEKMQRPSEDESSLSYLLLTSGRIILWWCIAEYMIHVMYMHSIQSNETYLAILPPWALGGLALALVQFFYVKYLVLFGLPSMLATLDKLVPPKLPRCVSIMYSFTGMWRHFDEGLYRWLIRYVYVPLGGSRHGPLYKMLSTGLAFGFVCLWHGGNDYLQYWALMNWAGVLMENGLKSLFASPFVHAAVEQTLSPAMKRRCIAFLSAFSTAMLILSNLVFLGGIHVARVFWKRVFIQGWCTIALPMLAFLYCFAQVGLEWTSHPP